MVKKIFLFLLVFMIVGISCKAADRDETLEWEQIISSDFWGWNIYESNTSGSGYAKVPNSTNPSSPLTLVYTPDMVEPYTLELTLAIPVGIDYDIYFVATALDLLGNESEYSNEATKHYFIPILTTIPTTIPPDETPPEAPYNLRMGMLWFFDKIALDVSRKELGKWQ